MHPDDVAQQYPETEDEALASVASNPHFNFVKFILTDSKPNANKQRIPDEEFPNLIKTGLYTPFKKAVKTVEDGHDFALPLGVITNLKQEENYIVGIAALWNRERPEDVEQIKEAIAEKKPLNVSWEILYTDSKTDDDGVENLYGTSLRAATIVGLPAYSGRTPIFAFASTQEDTKLEELEKLQAKLADAEKQLADANELLAQNKETIAELTPLKDEVVTLREFKASIDAEKEKAEKLDAIKTKFAEAGLEKEDKFFEDNAETLLSFSDNALDFFIQEQVSFAEANQKESGASRKLPNMTNDGEEMTIEEIVEALKKRNSR